ncbi:nucleotidyltransferase [Bacillus aerolatus]|uniref:tRNA(Met) cytidine acetate ligase n=1 Tax=Bacillus aerolatus TaxID=2653354 RepID=A0A6I1FHR9_9BACI|nr:nucleotidyltransferase [Bacillus aerolatus]KAB7707957.1 nucleotidyltransferase [Bacillus aerolatus]
MKTVGLVVEYNPFHNGHLYHAQKARESTGADVVIAVMSGHFLQRGEPALVNKWARTRMALQNGVDIVVELPYAFSVQKAEYFSNGAISILHGLFCESFCFGSENGHIAPFLQTLQQMKEKSHLLEPLIHQYMNKGFSFPKAQTLAREELFENKLPLDLSRPNNILGFHYIRANNTLQKPMKPLTITRQQADFHEETLGSQSIASATGIRKAIFEKQNGLSTIEQYVPAATLEVIAQYLNKYGKLHHWDLYWPLLQYRLLSSSAAELANIYDVAEGIEHRLKEASLRAQNFSEFMQSVKTKRYTWTRIQRMLVHILLHVSKEDMAAAIESVRYVRLLGMNGQGREYLNRIKKNMELPLITRAASYKEALALDVKAAEVYALGLPPHSSHSLLQSEFNEPPIILP